MRSPYTDDDVAFAAWGVPSSRTMYIVLALLLGGVGVHNFYAHHNAEGMVQLAIYLLTLAMWFGGAAPAVPLALSLVLLISIMVNIVTVTEDGEGRAFR